jgi:hypothetical protein
VETFFDKYATKIAAFLTIIVVGIAYLMGKPDVGITQFLEASIGSTAILGVRSSVHAIANKNNHTPPTP